MATGFMFSPRCDSTASCCTETPDVCEYSVRATIRGGNIYGQLDSQPVVYNSNANNPAPTDEIGFDTVGLDNSVDGNFTMAHEFRIWADAAAEIDVVTNEIVITVTTGTVCIDGITYDVAGSPYTLTDMIPIIVDPSFPSDNSGEPDGIVLVMDCGDCP